MTKTTDVLKPYTPKERALQDELAEVYFSKKPQLMKRLKKTLLIRRWAPLPLLIPIGLSLTLVALTYVAVNRFYRQDINALRLKVKTDETVKILEGGRLNASLVRTREENGGVFEKRGVVQNKFISLGNARSKISNFSIDFKFPIDISDKKISIIAKGRHGGEALSFSIRDVGKRAYRLEDMHLSSSWSNKYFSLAKLRGIVDLTRISHMRIEFDDVRFNKRYSVDKEIYIKELALRR